MPKYATTWKDYRLPTGQEFAMAICGYNNKVRHMTIGNDPLRRMFVREVTVEGGFCSTAQHCLALDCPLNKTEAEHLSHMLDMRQDEPVDPETATLWGRDTAVSCLVEMARRFSLSLENQEANTASDCEPPA